MSDPLDIPSWARKSPSRTKKKKRTKKITQKQQQQIDQDKPVSLFGEKGGKLEAPVDKLNHHNLPSRWFANSSHGPKEPTPAPTGNKVRPFPPTIAKTTRARKFGDGPGKNIPRATILRYNENNDADEASKLESTKSDVGTVPTETLSTRVRDPSFLKLDQSKLALDCMQWSKRLCWST